MHTLYIGKHSRKHRCLFHSRSAKRLPANNVAGHPNVSQQTTFSHLQTTVNVTVFADCLRRQSVYTDPADSADKFADQLEQSVVSVLDELAPLKTCSKHCGRWSNRWLSESAVAAKRKRRRPERRWYRTRRQADRVVYRSVCREANAEIIKSRQSFCQQRLDEAAGNQGAQWKIVHELLHSDDDHAVMELAEAKRLCDVYVGGKVRVSEFMIFLDLQHRGSK